MFWQVLIFVAVAVLAIWVLGIALTLLVIGALGAILAVATEDLGTQVPAMIGAVIAVIAVIGLGGGVLFLGIAFITLIWSLILA